jgi:hypothetical protein
MMSSSLFMVQLKYSCQKGNVLHSLSRCCNISIWLSAGFLGVCWGLERKHKQIICRINECLPPMGCVPIVKHKSNVIMNLNIHKAFRKKTLLHSEWAESHESASAWFIQCNPLFNLSKCSDVISFQNALCNVRDLLWCFKVLALFTQAPPSFTWAENYEARWGNALRYTSNQEAQERRALTLLLKNERNLTPINISKHDFLQLLRGTCKFPTWLSHLLLCKSGRDLTLINRHDFPLILKD